MSYRFEESFRAGPGWNQFHPGPGRVSCRSKFGKLVHLVGFIIKKFVKMHGLVNVNYI